MYKLLQNKLSMFTFFPSDITALAPFSLVLLETILVSPKSEPTRAHRLKLHCTIPHAQIPSFREKNKFHMNLGMFCPLFYRIIVVRKHFRKYSCLIAVFSSV